jgi:hypothetical protein
MFEEIEKAQTPDRSLRQKLNKMFSRKDYVGITNPLKKEFSWIVALEENEIVDMSQADAMQEDSMAARRSGTFAPLDGATRSQSKVTRFTLQPGEKKMIVGEAAYVIVPRIYNALVRQKFGTNKAGLAHIKNPSTQEELIPKIVIGPLVNNVGQAIQTFVNEKMTKIDGFTDVQARPRGFADPAVAAKARATREANRTKVEDA